MRHRGQSGYLALLVPARWRNGGHVPYAQHCERVRHLLAFVLDETGEATGEERKNILLAGLGHDLLEDTISP
jgi:hypothetical protein